MKQHISRFLNLVETAKSQIKEISPEELKQLIQLHAQNTSADSNKLIIIDVRELDELKTGWIPGAVHISKGTIERDIEKYIPNINTPIVVYCSGGFRCALVTQSLNAMGYTHVSSLNTGLQGWINAGYELERGL